MTSGGKKNVSVICLCMGINVKKNIRVKRENILTLKKKFSHVSIVVELGYR
jgi:hypothetical protein